MGNKNTAGSDNESLSLTIKAEEEEAEKQKSGKSEKEGSGNNGSKAEANEEGGKWKWGFFRRRKKEVEDKESSKPDDQENDEESCSCESVEDEENEGSESSKKGTADTSELSEAVGDSQEKEDSKQEGTVAELEGFIGKLAHMHTPHLDWTKDKPLTETLQNMHRLAGLDLSVQLSILWSAAWSFHGECPQTFSRITLYAASPLFRVILALFGYDYLVIISMLSDITYALGPNFNDSEFENGWLRLRNPFLQLPKLSAVVYLVLAILTDVLFMHARHFLSMVFISYFSFFPKGQIFNPQDPEQLLESLTNKWAAVKGTLISKRKKYGETNMSQGASKEFLMGIAIGYVVVHFVLIDLTKLATFITTIAAWTYLPLPTILKDIAVVTFQKGNPFQIPEASKLIGFLSGIPLALLINRSDIFMPGFTVCSTLIIHSLLRQLE